MHPFDVLDLACGAKKHARTASACSGPRLEREKKSFTDRLGGLRRAKNAKKVYFAGGLRKKTYTAARGISENGNMRKRFISQVACEKKTYTAPRIWGVRKKTYTAPPIGAVRKKTFTTAPEMPTCKKSLFRTKLESMVASI